MPTALRPLYVLLNEYTQSEETAYAATLTGKGYGFAMIYNTTLGKSRVWNGTAFITPPAAPAPPVYNSSTAVQSGFNTDTYLIGSSCPIPDNSLQVKTMYRVVFNVVKTAAGTGTPVINVRIGTAGTIADTSRGTLTHTAGTAVIDEGVYELFITFRVVGASSVIQTLGRFTHRLSVTGLTGTNAVSEPEIATSGTFNSGVSNSIIGVSVNGGTSAAWTVQLVQAELINLA